MDNVTHALAGALMGMAGARVVERRAPDASGAVRPLALWLGVITAEFPDLDLVYSGEVLGMGKLGYLLHHRGHTHTVLAAIAGAFLCWAIAIAWKREWRAPAIARPLLGLALAGTLSHLALDFTNNYGVHPWWPLSGRWYYGDAVFIVEPWLWIVALGPLVFLSRSLPGRALCALLLLAILAAVWRVGMVRPGTAAIVTVGAAAWTLISWRVGPTRRLPLALAGWLLVEAIFFAASRAGQRIVAAAAGRGLVDAVLTPGPGDPTCLSALVLSVDGDTYLVRTATVAPLARWRTATDCGNRGGRGDFPADEGAAAPSAGVAWAGGWRGSLAELRGLAAGNCEVAAALRFIRIPVWQRRADNRVELSDARYGVGSFASIVTDDRPGRCPRFVPGWIRPRAALLPPPAD